MTQRLPIPGSDDGDWGNILNSYLEVSHNPDGSLQPTAINAAGGVTSVNGANPVNGTVSITASGIGALTQTTANNLYAPTGNYISASDIGAVNGVAGLNGSGQIPSNQLGLTSASAVRTTSGSPTVLSSDVAGDFAIDMTSAVIYGPFNGVSWPTPGISLGQVVPPFSPTTWGYTGMTVPEGFGASQGLFGTGTATTYRGYWMRFRSYTSQTVSHMDYWLQTLGNNLTQGCCYMGLYDTGQATSGSATQLVAVDTTTLWGASGTIGLNTITLPSPVSLVAGEDYYAFMTLGQPPSNSAAPSFTGMNSQIFNPSAPSSQRILGQYNQPMPLPTVISMNNFYIENTTFQIGIRQ